MINLYEYFGDLFYNSNFYNLSNVFAYLMSVFYTIVLCLVPLLIVRFVFNMFDIRR